MEPCSVPYLLRNHQKYLFTILILATISLVGFTIEKVYPQQEDSQLKGPAMNSQKSDESTSLSDAQFTPKMYVKLHLIKMLTKFLLANLLSMEHQVILLREIV